MKKRESHIVPALSKEVRLSDYVPGIFKTIPFKKGMKKAIERGKVQVNGEVAKTSKFLKGGEEIVLFDLDEEINIPVYKKDLDVLFEDDHLAIINKPPGLVVSGNKFQTVENALPHNLKKSDLIDRLVRPHPVHRLDFMTSGLLLIGKTHTMVTALSKVFENHKVSKTYHAVVTGNIEKKGVIKQDIKGKKAETSFELLKSMDSDKYNGLHLLKLVPKTGRRHQLRIHLSDQGNVILGDIKYQGRITMSKGNGLYLHATSLAFKHPATDEEISVSLDLPSKFVELFNGRKRPSKEEE